MRKGQLFTLDVMAAMVFVTIVGGYLVFQQELYEGQAEKTQFKEMSFLADDVAQVAVKNLMANQTNYTFTPNFLNDAAAPRAAFQAWADQVVTTAPSPYRYFLTVPTSNPSPPGSGTLRIPAVDPCSSSKNVAISRRPVFYDNDIRELTVKVCLP